ncbi:conserved Plasmodium protein, unknown function [Plasmodium gallinaceum]|uniref:Uncharacterized protein n=1 Tax=Plasmodium gallinaceum TaxID=5849 RepID=A0A1J1GX61_PLAGA|nr:conserved Plasmodium protein, unknown function [Plasmodium gallinaceum]CRG96840.1 conserved Plasmodium protein, unknown function [Plasmodium gallinaceum]
MDELKEIIYELKKLKKNLRNKVVNINYYEFINNNYYIEKKIIYNLYQIIKSYYYLLTFFSKTKKKKKKEKEKKRNYKDKYNKKKNDINEETILKKLQKKKILQNRYTKKIKDFLKTNKSINIFKDYIEKNFLIKNYNSNNNKKKNRIIINIETNIYFNNFVTHIINFLYLILQNNINHENFKNIYSSNELRINVHKFDENSDCSYNINNEESIQSNEFVNIINIKNKKIEDINTTFNEENSKENNKLLKDYIFCEENILKKDNLKIGNTFNEENISDGSNITEHLDKKKEKEDDHMKNENYFFFHLYKKNMYLINKDIESYYCYNSFIIRNIDSNLLYIIDNDMNLLKILFYFDVVNLFVIYLYMKTCKNEEMRKYISILLIITIKFKKTFKLSSNTLIENKNIPILFYIFSNILKKNIFKINNRNNENNLTITINNNTSNNSLYKLNSNKKNNLYFLINLNELYITKTTNDIKNMNGIKKKKNTFLFSYKNSEYYTSKESLILVNNHNNIIKKKKINKININDIIKDKIEKNDYYYSFIKDENEIDSVNLTLSINNTKNENILFHKSYITEHIYNLFLNKYNLKLEKNIISNQLKKEENNISLFDNYKKIFHNFFFY